MYLIPFVHLFPDQAIAETRTMTTRNHPVLPDDEYALVEAYCADPQCDCRRVMLNVLARRQGKNCLASISFGFDRDEKMAGPFLDPLNPQSQYADVLLDLVTMVLADPTYLARLESHYHQVKRAADDPTHPVYRMLTRSRRGESRPVRRRKRSRRRRR
jgi:hypothetical protein